MKNEHVSDGNIPNILIVDDITANLKVLGDILKSYGYKVRPVPSGAMALQVAEKEIPDLILLDIMMPEMDGYEVCRRLKENKNLCDIPVIFISALNDTSDIVKAFTSGGVDYITKPFQSEEVKARVATHLKICQQKQKLLEQSKQLSDLMKTKDKLFSIISHDLRSPFTVILGYSELLAERTSNFEKIKIKEFATDINTVATATLVLLDNLLEWSRIQRGILVPNIQRINIKEIALGLTELCGETAKRKGVVFQNNIQSDAFAYCDVNMLKTILRNLISNAIKYTNMDGMVSIDVAHNDSFCEINVSDNGTGIPSEKIPLLFHVDRSLSTVGTANEMGSGLGLVLCKELVELQKGRIWFESEVDKGSTFSFSLPNIM
ncbi:MAG: hybrid sensor histidine kinase/response regulator [Bacteroidota bacterium]